MSTTGKAYPEIEVRGDLSYLDVQGPDPDLSDQTLVVLEPIFFVGLWGPISVLGSAANVVNIIIFYKQRFKDSVNISLCALTVSDLSYLLFLVWGSICYNPLFQYSDIDFDSAAVHFLTGGLTHSCFVRSTGLITAFITFERCVCVALPLKVKTIITPKRTLISIVVIFIIVFATTVPLFSSIYLAPLFQAKRNKTLIGLAYTSNAGIIGNVSFSVNISIQIFSFIIVTICTVILVMKLITKFEWRRKVISTSDVTDAISVREKKVVKMVASISVIFIICYFPHYVNLIMVVHLSPLYSATGRYRNVYHLSWAIINTIQGINTSVNIIVYYNMSSKFKATFKTLFSKVPKLTSII